VTEWGLPPAPTKRGDTRSRSWDGIGQVELDAVDQNKLRKMCTEAINEYFDEEKHNELMEQEAEETEQYQEAVKEGVMKYLEKDDE